MIPSDFHFHQIHAGYLLLLLPLLVGLFYSLFHFRKRVQKRLGDLPIFIPRSNTIYWLKCSALCLAWIFATLALMQPEGNGHYPGEGEIPQKGRRAFSQVILLIDCSGSMAIADSRGGMTRFDYAKDIADQLVSKLTGQSISLNGFTSEVTPLSPPTMDYLFVRLMLRQMQINEGDVAGTDILKALKTVHQQILEMPEMQAKRLILISDGGDTTLELLPEEEKERALSAFLNLFDNIPHLHIDAIGMGSTKGGVVPDVTYLGNPVHSGLEEELLQRVARRGGGHYIRANDSTAPAIAEALTREIDQAKGGEEVVSPSVNITYDPYFQIPLGLALLFILFAMVWPDTRVGLLLFLLITPLMAEDRYFEAKQYFKALDLYEVMLKRPVTPWQRSVIQYNIGCIELASGHLEAAIATWESIPLGADPFPLLARRIHANIAVAKLMQVEQGVDIEKGHFLLQEALAYIKRAEKEECQQQKLEGAALCFPAKDLELIEGRIKEYLAKERIKKVPQNLLEEYQLALIDDPLQEKVLMALIEKQKEPLLQLSLKALQEGHPLTARFYLQQARFQLTKILQPAKRTVEGILDASIETLHRAVILNRLAERMDSEERNSSAIQEGLSQAQKALLEAAAPFKSVVYTTQVQKFREGCQAQPWEELLPLFDAGWRQVQAPTTLANLEEALQKWEEARKALLHPKKEGCKMAAPPMPEEKMEEVPMKQVLRNVQLMEEEESKPLAPQPPPKEARPW